jgi:hypothetical protein
MRSDIPKRDGKSNLRKVLLVAFLLGLWLLGAVSGMLIFNLVDFIRFHSRGHVLVLILLILGSIVLMVSSYLFFPREKDENGKKERGGQ